MNSHARFAAHTAQALGYAFRSLDGDDAYLFEVAHGERRACFSSAYGTPYALNSACAYSLARDKSFSQRALDLAGLPTIPTLVFFANDRQRAYRGPGREREDALEWARTAQFPIFCKPNQGSKGEFAEIVASPAAFADYLDRVGPAYDVILAQPLLHGEEHRVVVLGGEALASYRKTRPTLVGDGVTTLRGLIERAQTGWKASAARSPADAYNARDAGGALLGLAATPAAGETIVLEGRANRAAGGDADRVAAGAPAQLGDCAIAAADAIGLGLAGVDIFDLSPARDLSDLVIIEVNANPAVETLVAHGRLDLVRAIWTANFEAALK
jgi:glutathione synthase/RimK-type ligase-like ATP-grasp enzyme